MGHVDQHYSGRTAISSLSLDQLQFLHSQFLQPHFPIHIHSGFLFTIVLKFFHDGIPIVLAFFQSVRQPMILLMLDLQ